MKIALAQMDSRVADLAGNAAKIREFSGRARAAGADLVVFPEHALGGYPALDLWEYPEFLQAHEKALAELARETGEMGVLLGTLAANPGKVGKPVVNAAALLHRGKVAALRAKTLLPTYDVFDEARYFEPARSNAPIRFGKLRVGVSVCEDAWAQEPSSGRRLYAADPVRAQAKAGVDLLVNLSASPFSRGKTLQRERLLSAHAKAARVPMLYCNAVGGNDEIVLDGSSLVLDARGRLVARGRGFAEDLVLVDTEALPKALPEPHFPGEVEEVAEALTLGIRSYVRKCGFNKVFIGLSGGIDSALVCALAARALGPEQVVGVSMPSRYSSEHSRTDAAALARSLGIRYLTLPIEEPFKAYLSMLGPVLSQPGMRDLAEQNLQSRVRGTTLMALSNHEGGLVLSTGNKSEMSVGYCTLYGDMNGGLAVLADVPKRLVYAVSRWLNREREIIPAGSLEKAPSAELKPGQFDQDDLPPYDTVDAVVEAYIEERLAPSAIAARGHDKAQVADLVRRIDRNEYKRRQSAPCIKISIKAFGVGRRMPIARGSFR